MSNSPANPIEAVTHPDPYPYYESLIADRPVYYDKNLSMWIVSSAEAVTSVLTSDLCRVRPVDEPVPRALADSPAGEIFGRLVRMNDRTRHCPFKRAISSAIGLVRPGEAEKESEKWARALGRELDTGGIAHFAFRLPVYTMAVLLGFAPDELFEISARTREFVACIAPGANSKQIEKGNAAADRLLGSFRALLSGGGRNLLASLAEMTGRENENTIIANGVGFLSQAYEATAGLIGNTLVALGNRRGPSAEPDHFVPIVREVSRFDPPVQNTRRFAARDGTVAGVEMKAGDAVLVVLAAANRDPAANRDSGEFDIFREDRRSFTFGVGPHSCPGERLAVEIAAAGVKQLLESGVKPGRLKKVYRNSVNTRIPLFI